MGDRVRRATASASIQLTTSVPANVMLHHDTACLNDSPSIAETTRHASTNAAMNQRTAHGSAWTSVSWTNENRSSAVVLGRISGPNNRRNEKADTGNALNQESLAGRRKAS